MKFAVDCMLGKLAKWLKVLGFDVVFFSRIEDEKLIDLAGKEGRVLLTKDLGMIQRSGNVLTLFIESDDWHDQVVQVLDKFDLRSKANPYSRCIECNVDLKDLPKSSAKNMVSSFVYEKAEKFSLCPKCGRVFWRGTHFEDMESTIESLLK
jgi:uncharacterized protein with PIN domain